MVTPSHHFYRDSYGRPVLRRRPPPEQEGEAMQAAARDALGHHEPDYLTGDDRKTWLGAAAMLASALIMFALIGWLVLAILS